MKLTDEKIAYAKSQVTMSINDKEHAHPENWTNDSIRIAHQWLSPQITLQKTNKKTTTYKLKHYIEQWAGAYIPEYSVKIAAYFLKDIKLKTFANGTVHYFNISSTLIEPSKNRLTDIQQAFSIPEYLEQNYPQIYSKQE